MERPSPGTVGRKVWAVLEQPQTVSVQFIPQLPWATQGLGAREVIYLPLCRTKVAKVTEKLLFTYDRFIIFEWGYAHFLVRLFHSSAF